ncbi:MAG: hypothetical protein ABIP94_19690 [Planctomycetota bacterium]
MSNSGLRILTFLSLLFASCGADATVDFGEPRLVSRDQRPTTWDALAKLRLGLPDMKAPSGPAGQAAAKRWSGTTPVGWEELPAQPARFRDAVWRVAGSEGTECYLSAGVGGGVAMNMSRWYTQQFGIQQVPATESLPVVEMAGRTARLVELAGDYMQKPGQAVLLAFYAEGEQVTSLKFNGPEAVVKGNREKFLELAKSLRTATASPDGSALPIQPGQPMPKDHLPMPGAAPHAQTPTPAGPAAAPFTATVPAGWTAKAESSRPLHYTFGTDGEVYLSQLGGGLRPMLDIWRGEVGLAAMTDAEWNALGKAPMLEAQATLLDVAGDFHSMTGKQIAGARLLVATLLEGGSITFVKLVGAKDEVEAQRPAFLQFCASLRRTP